MRTTIALMGPQRKAARVAGVGALVTLALWLALGAETVAASEAGRAVAVANTALSTGGRAPDAAQAAAARAAAERAVAANDDPDAVAEALLLLGQLDEDATAFARAIERDRACVAAAPASLWATRATARIDWLRARSEGDFGPLTTLERVRRDPALADDPRAIAALAEQAAHFPPGQVRVEAHRLVAEAWLGRLHRPDRAIASLRLVESDPEADPLTARLAERELVDAEIAQGQIDEAAREARAHSHELDPQFVAQVGRLTRRRMLLGAAVGELALFSALAAAALLRAAKERALDRVGRSLRGVGPIAAGFAAYVALVGGALASGYEAGDAAPFLWLGVVIVPLVVCARAWSAVGATHLAARVGRATLSGASVLAAAFVLLDTVNPTYLDGFGL